MSDLDRATAWAASFERTGRYIKRFQVLCNCLRLNGPKVLALTLKLLKCEKTEEFIKRCVEKQRMGK